MDHPVARRSLIDSFELASNTLKEMEEDQKQINAVTTLMDLTSRERNEQKLS